MNENNQKRHWDVEAENDEGEFYTVLSNYYGTYEEASNQVNFDLHKIEEELGLFFKIEFIAK